MSGVDVVIGVILGVGVGMGLAGVVSYLQGRRSVPRRNDE